MVKLVKISKALLHKSFHCLHTRLVEFVILCLTWNSWISSEFFGLSFNFMLYIYFKWTGTGYHISTIKTRLKTGKENKQNKKKKYVYVHLGAAAEDS